MTAFIFVDTNVLLHFRRLGEIPWDSVVNQPRVKILITRGVIRELDRIKSDHGSSKIRDRARGVLKEIDTWHRSTATEVRLGVSVQIYSVLPRGPLADLGLDAMSADDVLIATLKEFQPDEPGKVWLATDDTGARITARTLDVSCIELPEKLRLPEQQDPLVLENAKLKEDLRRAVSVPRPQLALRLADGQPFLRIQKPAPPDHEQDLKERTRVLAEIREQHPPLLVQETEMGALGPAPEEIERYNGDLETYIKTYGDFYDAGILYKRQRDLTFLLGLQLENVGRLPADDIDVSMHFPDGFEVTTPDLLAAEPTKPALPRRPRSVVELSIAKMVPHLGFASPMPRASIFPMLDSLGPKPNVSELEIVRTESHVVSCKVRRLKHGDRADLGELAIVYLIHADLKSFELKYRINAANMPDDVEGSLPVVFDEPVPQESADFQPRT